VLDATVAVLLVAFPLIGFATGRPASVALPLVGWPLFYVGLDRRWWLDGTGDGWQAIAIGLTLVGVVTTATAVAVRSALTRDHRAA
jgi:hypothetical protein